MIERDGSRLYVSVPMTLANATALLEAGRAGLQGGEQWIDLSRVTTVDSSALAVMLGWLRAAPGLRSTLRFAHIPAAVTALAELYGVAELLPRA